MVGFTKNDVPCRRCERERGDGEITVLMVGKFWHIKSSWDIILQTISIVIGRHTSSNIVSSEVGCHYSIDARTDQAREQTELALRWADE